MDRDRDQLLPCARFPDDQDRRVAAGCRSRAVEDRTHSRRVTDNALEPVAPRDQTVESGDTVAQFGRLENAGDFLPNDLFRVWNRDEVFRAASDRLGRVFDGWMSADHEHTDVGALFLDRLEQIQRGEVGPGLTDDQETRPVLPTDLRDDSCTIGAAQRRCVLRKQLRESAVQFATVRNNEDP